MSEDKGRKSDTSVASIPSEDITRTPPYGRVESLDKGERYCINRIEIKPGEHMSTQMHYHRSEHWIVVSGTAKVVCNGEETLVMQYSSSRGKSWSDSFSND